MTTREEAQGKSPNVMLHTCPYCGWTHEATVKPKPKTEDYEPVRPAPTPWQWHAQPLPPHDVELWAADTQVIARWSGELLDELGMRQRIEEDFTRICEAINAALDTEVTE